MSDTQQNAEQEIPTPPFTREQVDEAIKVLPPDELKCFEAVRDAIGIWNFTGQSTLMGTVVRLCVELSALRAANAKTLSTLDELRGAIIYEEGMDVVSRRLGDALGNAYAVVGAARERTPAPVVSSEPSP